MDILNQSWSDPLASTKKFLAREIMYKVSKQINALNFEVVLDGDLDLFNKTNDQPDVVIYQHQKNFSPVIAIEITTSERFAECSARALTLFNVYSLQEYLLYNLVEDRWYSIRENNSVFSIAVKSEFLNIPLNSFSVIYA